MTVLGIKVLFCNLFLISLLLNGLCQVLSLKCKNEQNQDVDWYVMYKLPKLSESPNPLIKEGSAYLYMDSDNFQNGWILSEKDISSKDSIPGLTLAPFYSNKDAKDLLWLLYNDKAPNKDVVLDNGHTKGAVVVNGKEGFWLIHSVPNFPPEPEIGEESRRKKIEKDEGNTTMPGSKSGHVAVGEYDYPPSGKVYGQSFLCISSNADNFDIIGKQLMYNQVIVFKKNLPNDLSQKFTVLADAANEKKIKKAPFNNKVSFNSPGGMEFTSFAKSNKWNKELYDNFVAPELNTDLYAETWLNGRGKLPSDCNSSSVLNIESISLSKADTEFKSSHDHSKWAVSIDGKKKGSWVCIGDINRAGTQMRRGGGTVCFNLPEVWKSYKDSVKDVEPCPKKKKGLFGRVKSWFGKLFS